MPISTLAINSSLIGVTAIASALAAEVSTYAWHRWGCHTKTIGIIHVSHDRHHTMHDRSAIIDFIIASIITIMLTLVIQIITRKIPWKYITMCTTTACFVFSLYVVYKQYIHSAYHTSDHSLNKFAWFRRWKRLHQIHHEHPDKNFAISCFTIDKMFGTFADVPDIKHRSK